MLSRRLVLIPVLTLAAIAGPAYSDEIAYSFGDLKAFRQPTGTWEVVGAAAAWLARQNAKTFTGNVVDRGEFGKTWGI